MPSNDARSSSTDRLIPEESPPIVIDIQPQKVVHVIPPPQPSPNHISNVIIIRQIIPAQPPPPRLELSEEGDEQPVAVHLNRQQKTAFYLAITFSYVTLISLLVSALTPWFKSDAPNSSPVYPKQQYLWLFLISPSSILVISLGSIFTRCRGSLVLKCWAISVITMVVPSLVMFVSFGSSLVFTLDGIVYWQFGAYFILMAHAFAMASSLTYLKFNSQYEIELRRAEDARDRQRDMEANDIDPAPQKGPITFAVGEQDLL